MSLQRAKLPKLIDKHIAEAEAEAEELRIKKEKEDEEEKLTIKKATKKD